MYFYIFMTRKLNPSIFVLLPGVYMIKVFEYATNSPLSQTKNILQNDYFRLEQNLEAEKMKLRRRKERKKETDRDCLNLGI